MKWYAQKKDAGYSKIKNGDVKLKQIQAKQYGRSFIEMLAVLALVGILSVMSVVGVSYALSKYRANRIIQEVMLWATVIVTNEEAQKVAVNDTIEPSELKDRQYASGYPMFAQKMNDDIFAVFVRQVSERVCRAVLKGPNPSDFYIDVNGVSSKEASSGEICQETNQLAFYFDFTQEKEWCGGQICTNGHVCDMQSETCVCPEDRVEQNGICVCPEGMEECNGVCYEPCDPNQPGNLGVRDSDSCQCRCDEVAGFHALANGQTCQCQNGFVLNGQCMNVECTPQGCEDGTCTCWLINAAGVKEKCGQYCDRRGSNCRYGFCIDNGQCPQGSIKYVVGNSFGDFYGCQTGNISCYYANGNFRCAKGDDQCGQYCQIDGMNCKEGDCENRCPAGTIYRQNNLSDKSLWGCYDEASDIECLFSYLTGIACYKSGMLCGTNCDLQGNECKALGTGENVSLCKAVCPDGLSTVLKENKWACERSDGFYCVPEVASYGGGAYRCYTPEGNQCGERCNADGTICYAGTCDASVCTGLGLSYDRYNSVYYGCSDEENNLMCIQTWNGIQCYKDNVLCGNGCDDLHASGCDDCFDAFECPDGFSYKVVNGGDGCVNDTTGVYCDAKVYQRCYYPGDNQCGRDGCRIDATGCSTGACSAQEADCSAPMIFGRIQAGASGIYGCIDYVQNLSCYRSKGAYVCSLNGLQCGSGCRSDGTGCSSGVCSASDCPSGQEPVYQDTTTFTCGGIVRDIVCSGSSGNYTCTVNGNVCGRFCSDENGSSCQYGVCSQDSCPSGYVWGYVTTGLYGCTNPSTYISCYPDNGTYTCWKDGVLCGQGCSVDGTGGTCDGSCV